MLDRERFCRVEHDAGAKVDELDLSKPVEIQYEDGMKKDDDNLLDSLLR